MKQIQSYLSLQSLDRIRSVSSCVVCVLLLSQVIPSTDKRGVRVSFVPFSSFRRVLNRWMKHHIYGAQALGLWAIFMSLTGSKSSSMWRDSPTKLPSRHHGGSHCLLAAMPASWQQTLSFSFVTTLVNISAPLSLVWTFLSCICLEFNAS